MRFQLFFVALAAMVAGTAAQSSASGGYRCNPGTYICGYKSILVCDPEGEFVVNGYCPNGGECFYADNGIPFCAAP